MFDVGFSLIEFKGTVGLGGGMHSTKCLSYFLGFKTSHQLLWFF